MDEHLQKTIDDLQEKVRQQETSLRRTKQLVNGLCVEASIPQLYPDAEGETSGAGSLRKDQFYGRPLATVIREYLEMRKAQGAATVREIYEALMRGGRKFETKNDANAMRALQISLSKNALFHRVPSGAWGLSIWYPSARVDKVDDEKEIDAEKSDNGSSADNKSEKGASNDESKSADPAARKKHNAAP